MWAMSPRQLVQTAMQMQRGDYLRTETMDNPRKSLGLNSAESRMEERIETQVITLMLKRVNSPSQSSEPHDDPEDKSAIILVSY